MSQANNPTTPPSGQQKGGFRRRTWQGVKFVVGSPAAVIGVGDIRKGAGFIGSLAHVVQRGPKLDTRLVIRDDGTIDMTRTAIRCNLTRDGLSQFMLQRRRRTTVATYICSCAGFLSIVTWFVLAIQMPEIFSRVMSALEFMPFCVMFFLTAFKAAWTNWQIRVGRIGSAMEYLSTTEPFMPC